MKTVTLQEWMNTLAEVFGREQVIASLKAIALWGIFGAILGLALSFALYRGFRRLRWYGATSTAGRWAQRGIFIVVTLITIALFGATGLGEGVNRQFHTALTRSQIGTEALPRLANELADGLAWLDLAIQHGGFKDEADIKAPLEEFRTGKRELDVPAFLRRLDYVNAHLTREQLDEFEKIIMAKLPKNLGGPVEGLARPAIRKLGTALLEKKLAAELQRYGVFEVYRSIREPLIAEAALTGHPATIGRQALAEFLLREGIIPAIVTPIRSFARQQQSICLLLALFVNLTPPLLCRAFRPKSIPPAASPASVAQ